MTYVGTYSTVLFSTLPFNIPTDASVDDSLVRVTNIMFPQPVTQDSLNLAYTYYPPATSFSLLSTENSTILLSMQEI